MNVNREKAIEWAGKIYAEEVTVKDIVMIGRPDDSEWGEWHQYFKVYGIAWPSSAYLGVEQNEPIPNLAVRKQAALDEIAMTWDELDLVEEYNI